MSLSGSHQFFAQLKGKATTFLLEGRQANLAFAGTMAGVLSEGRTSSTVLDLDAFYSSNSDRIFSGLDSATVKSAVIRVPRPGSDVETELSNLFDAPQELVMIDSLNTLYHLISLEDGSSRGKKLTFSQASLSYLAMTTSKAVVLTMYRREGLYRAGTARPISNLSDATATVDLAGGGLKIKFTRGSAWPGGVFSFRTPSL